VGGGPVVPSQPLRLSHGERRNFVRWNNPRPSEIGTSSRWEGGTKIRHASRSVEGGSRNFQLITQCGEGEEPLKNLKKQKPGNIAKRAGNGKGSLEVNMNHVLEYIEGKRGGKGKGQVNQKNPNASWQNVHCKDINKNQPKESAKKNTRNDP